MVLVIDTSRRRNARRIDKTVLPYFYAKDYCTYTRKTAAEKRGCYPRSIVPQVFKMAHDDAGHQGFDRTYDRLKGLAI